MNLRRAVLLFVFMPMGPLLAAQDGPTVYVVDISSLTFPNRAVRERELKKRLGKEGPVFFEREMQFAKQVIRELGWQEAQSYSAARLHLNLSPEGAGSVENPNPVTVRHDCATSAVGVSCSGSDGSSSAVTVLGNRASVYSRPGLDQSTMGYRANVLITVDFGDMTSVERENDTAPVQFSKPPVWTAEPVHSEWQWAWKLCEEVKGKHAGCKGRMQDLWKKTLP